MITPKQLQRVHTNLLLDNFFHASPVPKLVLRELCGTQVSWAEEHRGWRLLRTALLKLLNHLQEGWLLSEGQLHPEGPVCTEGCGHKHLVLLS